MPEAWKDRRAAGRDLRKVVPRSAHAEWAPPADRPDPVSVLAGQDTHAGSRAPPGPLRAHGDVRVRVLPRQRGDHGERSRRRAR